MVRLDGVYGQEQMETSDVAVSSQRIPGNAYESTLKPWNYTRPNPFGPLGGAAAGRGLSPALPSLRTLLDLTTP